jgi:hypothetical protein
MDKKEIVRQAGRVEVNLAVLMMLVGIAMVNASDFDLDSLMEILFCDPADDT